MDLDSADGVSLKLQAWRGSNIYQIPIELSERVLEWRAILFSLIAPPIIYCAIRLLILRPYFKERKSLYVRNFILRYSIF